MTSKSGPDDTIVILAVGTFRESQGGRRPVPKDMPGVKGVFVGGCVAKGFGSIGKKIIGGGDAHAHTQPGRYQGWVCFQLPEDLENKDLRMHELAHIITGQGHTDKWRAALQRLGQSIPPGYQKKTRKKRS